MVGEIYNGVLEWLLEKENPSIRYRTLTEILGESPESQEAIDAYDQILLSQPTLKIKQNMHPDGYWEYKTYKGEIVGSGVEYASSNTTHFVLGYLGELGLTRKEAFIEKAASRYLSLQKEDGHFSNHQSCLYGLNLRTYAKLGYSEDPRIEKTINLLLNSIRFDNGFLCDMHEGKRKKGRLVKSCYRGSVKALFGISEFPTYWDRGPILNLVDYFLNREVIFRTTDDSRLVTKEIPALRFPFGYGAGLIDILYPLSKMGYGGQPALDRAWALLESKKHSDGKYPLEAVTSNKYLKPGAKGKANKWTTFYVSLIKKWENQ